MPKKETPGVVRQDGTRGGGHLLKRTVNRILFFICSPKGNTHAVASLLLGKPCLPAGRLRVFQQPFLHKRKLTFSPFPVRFPLKIHNNNKRPLINRSLLLQCSPKGNRVRGARKYATGIFSSSRYVAIAPCSLTPFDSRFATK